MSLVLRRDLDRRLTIQELDGNFLYLENRLNGILVGPTGPTGPSGSAGITTTINIGDVYEGGVVAHTWIEDNVQYGFVISETDIPNGDYGWSDLSSLDLRYYTNFRDANNNRIGNNVLGQEFVMRETTSNRYWKFKFNSWTSGGDGGGFSYDRQEINVDGSPIGSTVSFTKGDYEDISDVIIEGVLVISRSNWQGIYNSALENNYSSNTSPLNTIWNSYYAITSYAWADVSDVVIGASSKWDGSSNTQLIVDNTTNSAAKACVSYSNSGYEDWYLPSSHELSVVLKNMFDINRGLRKAQGVEIGDFRYWTSTERSSDYAYTLDVGNYELDYTNKDSTNLVRAFRKFSIDL